MGNEVFALTGPLGAGKTTFVKGIADALDVKDIVISPTFVLVREYMGKHPLFHFDWYRMETEREVIELGYWDYIEREGIKIIEWPDKFPKLLPEDTKWLRIEIVEGGRKLSW